MHYSDVIWSSRCLESVATRQQAVKQLVQAKNKKTWKLYITDTLWRDSTRGIHSYLQKLQVLQNKLLKLLINFDRRMSTNELHHQLPKFECYQSNVTGVSIWFQKLQHGNANKAYSFDMHCSRATESLHITPWGKVPKCQQCTTIVSGPRSVYHDYPS